MNLISRIKIGYKKSGLLTKIGYWFAFIGVILSIFFFIYQNVESKDSEKNIIEENKISEKNITQILKNKTTITDYFDGDGITMNFTLSQAITAAGTSEVYVNGIIQREGALGSYVEHSTFIEFASAPPLYDQILVKYV